MPTKSSITFLSIYILLLFVPYRGISANYQENPLTRAIQVFDKGNYEEAEPLFKKLLEEKPDDFMINYFYGACRTENGHYSNSDLSHLVLASREVSPLDIDYYMGVQYQAKEDWEQALKHYNKYSKSASEEDLRKVNLSEKIQQCYDKVNPYEFVNDNVNIAVSNSAAAGAALTTTVNADSINITDNPTDSNAELSAAAATGIILADNDSSVLSEEIETENPDSLFVEAEPESETINPVAVEPLINFSINSEITYRLLSQFKTAEGKEFFQEGQEKQGQLNKTLNTLDFLRGKYASVYSRSAKDSLGQQILNLENYSYELKSDANQLLQKSKALENEYWQNASEQEIAKFISDSKKINEKPIVVAPTPKNVPKDSDQVAITDILVDDTPTETTTSNSTASSDLIYKIQIGAYSRGIPSYRKKIFDKLALIRKIDNYTDEKGVVVYTTGNLTRFEDALVMQKQVRQEGVDDAFIVPYLKGKRITLDQAKEIEGIK